VLKAENNQDIYLVFEYMETDLHAVIRAGILEPVHCRYIMWQLFRALKYMHSGDLLHRDIKPSNLLLNAECQVKVADFGLARSLAPEDRSPQGAGAGVHGGSSGGAVVLTDYVATRWYRAPEILLGSTNYTFGVDMWSCGCILAELLAGRPMFPGKSTVDQIERILDVTGYPSPAQLAACDSPYAAEMLASLHEAPQQQQPRRPLRHVLPDAPPDALDLLHKLLHFSPAQRVTAHEALRHPYVSQFHSPASEPACDRVITIPLDCNTKCGIEEYRDKLYAEIVKRKRELRRRMREKEAAKAANWGSTQSALHNGTAGSTQAHGAPAAVAQTQASIRASSGAAAPAASVPAPAARGGEHGRHHVAEMPTSEPQMPSGLARRPSGGYAAGGDAAPQGGYAHTYVHSSGASRAAPASGGQGKAASPQQGRAVGTYGRAGQQPWGNGY
jgi:mitogen-activated protein kinase 15